MKTEMILVASLMLCSVILPRTSMSTVSFQDTQGDCGCSDDPPFIRDRIPVKPQRADLAQITTDLSGDCATAAIASRKLGMIADRSSVGPLLRAMHHKSCRVRAAAADALGKVGDRRAVSSLISALADSDPRVRSGAAWSLADLPDSSAVPALLTAITDNEKHVRQAASTALGAIGDSRAASALTAALRDPQKDVRQAAAEALGKLRRPEVAAQRSESPAERCSWEGWLPPAAGRQRIRNSTHLDAATVSRLIARTRSRDKNDRMLAAERLGAAQDAGSMQALIEMTADSDPMVQEAAVRALGRRGAVSATPIIARLASSPNSHLRQGAVWALGQLQDRSALNAVITASRDTSKHVRGDATWALGLIGGPRASARVNELANDPIPQVRLAAACSLEMIHDTGDSRGRDTLLRLSNDTDPVVREVARWAIGRLTARSSPRTPIIARAEEPRSRALSLNSQPLLGLGAVAEYLDHLPHSFRP